MTSLPASLAIEGNAPLRPHDDYSPLPLLKRIGRLLKWMLLAGTSALLFIYIGLHAYIAWLLAYPPVAPLASNPLLAKNLPYTEIVFPSADGHSLVDGWWIPTATPSKQSVVLSHGYGANREEHWVPMYDLAEWLHGIGYNVLMFDYGFASSLHSLPATGGILESGQLLGAVQYAREEAGSEQVIVWGFSMGAGTALQAALQGAPIDAMILDSTFLPSDETLAYNLEHMLPQLAAYPTIPLIKWFLPLMSGYRLEQVPALTAQTTSFEFPVFLIHGTKDSKAPVVLAENVAMAQSHPQSRLWIVDGAIHEMIYRMHTKEYVQLISAFLEAIQPHAPAKSQQQHALTV